MFTGISYTNAAEMDSMSSDSTEMSWKMSSEWTWQDADGKWLKIWDNKLWWSTDWKTWLEVPEWKWEWEDGVWYKFDSDWTLWWSKDGVTWEKVEWNMWKGKKWVWYKLDSDWKLWWKAWMKRMMKMVTSKYKKSSLASTYKKSYFKRLKNVLWKVSVSRLEKISDKIDTLISKYESKNISDSKKEKIISKLSAIQEIIEENLSWR